MGFFDKALDTVSALRPSNYRYTPAGIVLMQDVKLDQCLAADPTYGKEAQKIVAKIVDNIVPAFGQDFEQTKKVVARIERTLHKHCKGDRLANEALKAIRDQVNLANVCKAGRENRLEVTPVIRKDSNTRRNGYTVAVVEEKKPTPPPPAQKRSIFAAPRR